MSEKTKPKLTKCSVSKPYTMIKFKPDLKRFGMTEEVSSLVEYLTSEKASYVTGQVHHINGGLY